jgi:hypothetical protein
MRLKRLKKVAIAPLIQAMQTNDIGTTRAVRLEVATQCCDRRRVVSFFPGSWFGAIAKRLAMDKLSTK